MPLLHITRRVFFNAAHRIHNPAMSDEWNKRTYGVCNSPNYHGHNYTIEVTVSGEPDPVTGYVVDLGILNSLLEEKILSRCDHKNLNLDVEFMKGVNPTSENLAVAIWQQLEGAVPAGRLTRVKVMENDVNHVEYRGE